MISPESPLRELFDPYSHALEGWLAARQESGLQRARELGAMALGQGMRASEMSALHHEALKEVMAPIRRTAERPVAAPASRLSPPSEIVVAAGSFFAAVIAPFEARYRDLRRSNAALRYQNTRLENDVHRFTQMIFKDSMHLLAAARLAMAAAGKEYKPDVGGPFDEVEKILEHVEDQLATISESLWPPILDDLGPRSAIESLCRRFARSTRLEIKAELGTFQLDPNTGLALYKVVREALSNIERHARASRVNVWLYEDNSVVHCDIQDDGVGFDVAPVLSAMEHRGSGLSSIAETMRSLGGTLAIESVLGGGTEIRVSMNRGTGYSNAGDQNVSRSAS